MKPKPRKRKNYKLLTVVFFVGLAFLEFLASPPKIYASKAEYQRCPTNSNCTIGEFLFDDDYQPIATASCTLTSRNPSGDIFLNAVAMTANSDGWYSYTFDTTGETNGLYRSFVCCTIENDYLCLDKSFNIGPSFLSTSDVAGAVWNSQTSTYSSENTFGANLQNPVLTAAQVWGYSSRTLSSFGTLIADIWTYSTRSLTTFGTLVADIWSNATRTLTGAGLDSGQLALQSDITSQTTEIKGTSDKDLTDISGEVAGVQSTADSIETKVDSLDTKVDMIDTNVDTIISKWSTYSAADMIGYVDQIESRLGDNADTCALDDTIFGNIQCVRDKWGTQTAEEVYTAANNAYNTVVSVRSELAYNGQSTTAYADIQTLKGYVDTLESSIGASTDTAATASVFGRIKKAQDAIDDLDGIETDIDTLVDKWGAYDAEDIYDKVKNLSSEISDINVVNNVSSILSLVQTEADDTTDVKNKLLAMKAVVDVNRMILDGLAHQPIVKTWLEESSIIFKTLITNPSQLYTQAVPLKYYLPREAKKEDIIKMDEGLKVEYDASSEVHYISGEFELEPGETKTFSVEVANVWQIPEEEIASWREQADELFKPLQNTAYFAQGSTLKSDIYASLDKVTSLQKNAYTPEARIRAFREAMIEIESAKRKIEDLKTLASSAGSTGTLFGFIGGVQTLSVWGMIIVLVAGFVFLALYFRTLRLREKQTETGIKDTRPIDFWAPVRNIKNQVLKMKNKKIAKVGLIILFLAGALSVAVKTINMTSNGLRQSPKHAESKSSPSPKPGKPTPTPIPVEKGEKKIKIMETGMAYLNLREGPGTDYQKIGKVDIGEIFLELERKENDKGEEWVKIKVDEETTGWVLAEKALKYIEVVSEEEEEAQETKIDQEESVLGVKTGQTVIVVVPAGVNGVNIREKPSLEAKIITHFWISQKVKKQGEENGWVKIEIEAEKEGVKYSEGWVDKQLVEELED
jgi:uncharacterized protein YgiM (DUF1202 family)